MIDLEPAARRLADLVAAVTDDRWPGPRCARRTRSATSSTTSTGSARRSRRRPAKDSPDAAPQGPSGDASRLTPDFRERIARQLDGPRRGLARPEAWTGMTQAGGVDLPG